MGRSELLEYLPTGLLPEDGFAQYLQALFYGTPVVHCAGPFWPITCPSLQSSAGGPGLALQVVGLLRNGLRFQHSARFAAAGPFSTRHSAPSPWPSSTFAPALQ